MRLVEPQVEPALGLGSLRQLTPLRRGVPVAARALERPSAPLAHRRVIRSSAQRDLVHVGGEAESAFVFCDPGRALRMGRRFAPAPTRDEVARSPASVPLGHEPLGPARVRIVELVRAERSQHPDANSLVIEVGTKLSRVPGGAHEPIGGKPT